MLYAVTTKASTKNICSNLNVLGEAQRPGLNSIRINLLHNGSIRADGGNAVFILKKKRKRERD